MLSSSNDKDLKSGQQGFVFMHPLQSLYPGLSQFRHGHLQPVLSVSGVFFPGIAFVKALLVSFPLLLYPGPDGDKGEEMIQISRSGRTLSEMNSE